mgnify:CR=1 FL=1
MQGHAKRWDGNEDRIEDISDGAVSWRWNMWNRCRCLEDDLRELRTTGIGMEFSQMGKERKMAECGGLSPQ